MPRDMKIPLSIGLPLMAVAMVLGWVFDWSGGAVGTVLTIIMCAMVAAGVMMVPREGPRK